MTHGSSARVVVFRQLRRKIGAVAAGNLATNRKKRQRQKLPSACPQV